MAIPSLPFHPYIKLCLLCMAFYITHIPHKKFQKEMHEELYILENNPAYETEKLLWNRNKKYGRHYEAYIIGIFLFILVCGYTLIQLNF